MELRPVEWVFLTKSKLRWDHHLWVNFGNASCAMTANIYPPKSVLCIQSFCFAYFLFSVIIVVALSLLVAFLCKHFFVRNNNWKTNDLMENAQTWNQRLQVYPNRGPVELQVIANLYLCWSLLIKNYHWWIHCTIKWMNLIPSGASLWSHLQSPWNQHTGKCQPSYCFNRTSMQP